MTKCSFCARDIELGTGLLFVTKEGKILPFCSRKCRKNLLMLKRKPIRVKWTETYRIEALKAKKAEAKVQEVTAK